MGQGDSKLGRFSRTNVRMVPLRSGLAMMVLLAADGVGALMHGRVARSVKARSAVSMEVAGLDVSRNVLGTDLQCCCCDVRHGIGTGFYRDGMCSTGVQDPGRHTVCVQCTAEFLAFSRLAGNDL